jgi:type III pantothenate kinase
MNLIIDIGNSRTKLAVFDGDKLIRQKGFERINLSVIKSFLKSNTKIKSAILSSVADFDNSISVFLKSKLFYFELNEKTPVPIKNKYGTPGTLGKDRVANAVGAAALFAGKNILIVDAGTCLKFDFIDKNKTYKGGAISPGLIMRYKSLHQFTARLPLVKPTGKASLTGNTTKASIISGVQNGMLFEIKGAIKEYQKKYSSLKVILAGGDYAFFANYLKNSIFAAPNLTLSGLNEILKYNAIKNS